jgi:glycosyltransferase involved in cell wall biosynthesis
MKILSLSSVYPNPDEPGLGLFVRSRLEHVARSAEVKVVAPLPILDYSNPQRKVYRQRQFPPVRWDGDVEIFHPRWLYPPLGTPLNVACLFARLFPLLLRLRRTWPFDLIDAHFCYPEGVTAALLASVFHVPFTITLRGSETIFDAYRFRRLAMRCALRCAAGIIAVSEDLRRFAISRGAAPGHIFTIPNGIDGGLFRPRDRAEMRRAHGLPLGRKLIVSAGELIEAKGHHLVIQALPALLASGIDAELVIAGGTARGGPRFEESLRRLVKDSGLVDRVTFAGWVGRQGLAELLAAADLFCLASYTEGWPNVVHEALACGAPVVATRVGGIPEMIPSERFGILIPPRDQDALEHALTSALQKQWDADAISDWGRDRDWDCVAREVLDVFAISAPAAAGFANPMPKQSEI